MLLPGCVRGGRSDDRLWAKIGLTLLPALLHAVRDRARLRPLRVQPDPDRRPRLVPVLARICARPPRADSALRPRRGATLAVMLALNCLAGACDARALRRGAVAVRRAYDGLTWSSGASGSSRSACAASRSPASTRSSPGAAAAVAARAAATMCRLGRRASDRFGRQRRVWVYSLERLRLAGTNLVVSASPDEWWRRLPMHVEMMVVMLAPTSALLLWLPDRRGDRSC